MDNLYTVDRIESDFAVIEFPNGSFENIGLPSLPAGVKEGSVLKKDKDGAFYISKADEKDKRKSAFDLQKEIFKKD